MPPTIRAMPRRGARASNPAGRCGAVIGADSVLTRDVAAGATVFGNPARARGA
jgi:hypothetical protein